MKFSYSGDPAASLKDAVRFNIGDTDECEYLLTDAEINYNLGLYRGSILQASIRCCEQVMAKFARRVNQTVGSVRLDYSNQIKQYAQMRDELRMRLAIEDCTPYAGGISRSDALQVDLNPDRIEPDFTRHMMQNDQQSPWVEGNTGGSDDIAPG